MSVSLRPVVTLLTDFSTCDEYVGAMKGAVLSLCRDVVLVDISHEIGPGDVIRGAIVLASIVAHYPDSSLHVAVVDRGVGSSRKALVIDCGDYILVGPDNGLLSLACPPDAHAYELDRDEFFAREMSTTFHGRDVFAPVAGQLAAGKQPFEMGTPVSAIKVIGLPLIGRSSEGIVGEVLYADHFGNLITNLVRADVASLGDRVTVRIGDTDACSVCVTYSDADAGTLVALIGGDDRLEIAVVEGSASERLGAVAVKGATVTLVAES